METKTRVCQLLSDSIGTKAARRACLLLIASARQISLDITIVYIYSYLFTMLQQ